MNAWMPSASSTAITMITASSISEPLVDFDFESPFACPAPVGRTGSPGAPEPSLEPTPFVDRTLTRAPPRGPSRFRQTPGAPSASWAQTRSHERLRPELDATLWRGHSRRCVAGVRHAGLGGGIGLVGDRRHLGV